MKFKLTINLFIVIFFTKNILSLEQTYPEVSCAINKTTVNMVKKVLPKVYAEIGIATGSTVLEIAKILPKTSTIYLLDFFDKVENVKKRLNDLGFANVEALGNSYKLRDSYNWSLMKLLSQNSQPIFDYVYLDGAHTWEIDGFAFMLIDKLLKPNGYIDFDDYNWNLKKSPALNPSTFPLTAKLYTEEQIEVKQVKLVVDLLVKKNSQYKEIVKNKIYQKKAN